MPRGEGISPRVNARVRRETMAALRKLGALNNVSADLAAQRLLDDLAPQLEHVVEWAQRLQEEHDPAGRGYFVWALHFPDPALSEEQGRPTLQPSGPFVVLHVGDKQFTVGNVIEVREPAREESGRYELALGGRAAMAMFPSSALVGREGLE